VTITGGPTSHASSAMVVKMQKRNGSYGTAGVEVMGGS